METPDYDLVIIGGGPAGLTAGLYAARARLKVIIVEKITPGGQILVTDWIENYPGFPEGLTGPDLVQKMTDQVKKFNLEIESEEVEQVDFSSSIKKIKLSGREISSHAVIIATGAFPRKIGVPGENTLYGKGLSSCATCDGPFFREKTVAAVGGGDTAVQESIFLTKFVNKVILIHRRDELRATKILQERVLANDKIEILWDTIVTGFEGLFNVERVSIKNVKTGKSDSLTVDGCFVWVGITPNTSFVKDAVKFDDSGSIIVNSKMETSVPGVFAAGDVRNTPLRQVATAVGDGAIAAVSAGHYIENLTVP